MITLNIPFSGFYDSIHNSLIDDAEGQLFSDYDGNGDINQGLLSRFINNVDYKKVFIGYARTYTESFKDDFNIPSLKFISLESPKSYNYSTDKIECSISRADIRRIYKNIDKKVLSDFVTEHCTSRIGFHSFYSPDLKSWGYVDNWEYAQLALLIQCYFENHHNYHDYWKYETMQEYEFNGFISSLLCEACPISARLYLIHDYLESRKSRGNK